MYPLSSNNTDISDRRERGSTLYFLIYEEILTISMIAICNSVEKGGTVEDEGIEPTFYSKAITGIT